MFSKSHGFWFLVLTLTQHQQSDEWCSV